MNSKQPANNKYCRSFLIGIYVGYDVSTHLDESDMDGGVGTAQEDVTA
ncbi:hypothetical protein WN943_023897 [Citrus x changshan-huyou]